MSTEQTYLERLEGYRECYAPRFAGVESPPNKLMYPTADTENFIEQQRPGAAGD